MLHLIATSTSHVREGSRVRASELHNNLEYITSLYVGCCALIAGKVFSRLNFNLPDDIIQGVVASKPGVIEFILTNLRNKVSQQQPSESTCQSQTGVDTHTTL